MDGKTWRKTTSMAGRRMARPHTPRSGGRLTDTEHTVIDKAGRMVLPAKLRRALGIRGRMDAGGQPLERFDPAP